MYLSSEVNQLRKNYSNAQKTKEYLVRNSIGSMWNLLTPEGKAQKLNEKSKELIKEFREKLPEIKNKIAGEKKNVSRKINSIKFPNLSSEDSNLRLIAENQITQAQIFLSSRKASYQITDAIKSALDTNRVDFAFTIIDSILNTRQEAVNEPLTQKTKELIQEVKNIYDTFEKKKEIERIEQEIEDVAILERVVSSFDSQLEQGKEKIMLIDLVPLMEEHERMELLEQVSEIGGVEAVATKRRISEILQSAN